MKKKNKSKATKVLSVSRSLKSNKEKPKKGIWIQYKIEDEIVRMKAQILYKQPKPNSKDSSYVNIISELEVAGSINWNIIECWKEISKKEISKLNQNNVNNGKLDNAERNTTITNNTARETKNKDEETQVHIKVTKQTSPQMEHKVINKSSATPSPINESRLLQAMNINKEGTAKNTIENLQNFKSEFQLKMLLSDDQIESHNYSEDGILVNREKPKKRSTIHENESLQRKKLKKLNKKRKTNPSIRKKSKPLSSKTPDESCRKAHKR